MIEVTIKGTTKKDRENLDLFKSHLCYSIVEEMDISITKDTKWDGYSGGDDAFFALAGSKVCVKKA